MGFRCFLFILYSLQDGGRRIVQYLKSDTRRDGPCRCRLVFPVYLGSDEQIRPIPRLYLDSESGYSDFGAVGPIASFQ